MPSLADFPEKRHHGLIEKRWRAGHGGGPPEQLVEPASIEVPNVFEGGPDERRVAIGLGRRLRGPAVLRGTIAGNELCEIARRQCSHAPDPPSGGDGRIEQSESLDVSVRVQTLAAAGTAGGHGAVPTLPNPKYVL